MCKPPPNAATCTAATTARAVQAQAGIRKRRRLDGKSKKCGCKFCPRHNTNRTSSLLCLPDEAVSLIFTYLNAGDTSFDFMRPRHAFALALTNTRLLRIFGTHLTRIVPCLDGEYYHPYPKVSRGHILSAMRIAGHSLRELHVRRSYLSILRHIHTLCPRVEKILLQDYEKSEGITEIPKVFQLPVRSLSIESPSKKKLELLPETPQELFLINIYGDDILSLAKVLHNPPKRLHLHVITMCTLYENGTLDYLHGLCPKVEDFEYKEIIPEELRERAPYRQLQSEFLMTLLKKPRLNIRSKCKKMVLLGKLAAGFVEYAHPEAYTVTVDDQTFVDNGDGIYPTKIPLWDEYLTQDLSRLTHVVIGEDIHPTWRKLLSNAHLKEAIVESTESLRGLLGKVDTVELDNVLAAEIDWKWIRGANEVRLVDFWNTDILVEVLESLAGLLDQCQGKVVFFEHYPFECLTCLKKKNYIVRSLLSFIRCAVDKFEACGGDARTVRYMIDRIRWACGRRCC